MSLRNGGVTLKPSPIDKHLPLLADLSFALYFATEVLLEHSFVSRICMLLFLGVTLLYGIRRRRAYFSWWLIFGAVLILWGAAGSLFWAIDRGASLSMVKTLAINLLFFFLLFQYLLLQGDMRRYFATVVLVTTAISAAAIAMEMPMNFEWGRVGNKIGVNPNWIGMLAAVAMGFSLILAAQKKKALWLLPILILAPTIVLSKSTKAIALAAVLTVALILILYPKYWYLKLLGLLAVGGTAFYFLIFQDNAVSNGLFHRYQVIAHYMIMGWGNADSVVERNSLATLAMEAFRQKPLTGWGLDCFRFLDGAEETYSHCNYTELLVSGGLPMLILYYGAQMIAAVLAIRALVLTRAKRNELVCERATTGALLILMLSQVVMDVGMVSYYDRTAAVYLVLLAAATRILENRASDGEKFYRFLENPRRVFVWLAEHGWFRRMNDETYLKRFYRARLGRELHLDPPVTMNEKLQWLKLHERRPEYVRLVDKVAVREFVSKTAGAEYLIESLGVWDDPGQINFSALPERFVLKCSHNSGGVIVCRDKTKLNRQATIRALRRQFGKNYFSIGREWLYREVTPRVLCEAFIGENDGTLPDDYKFFCFDGVVRAVCVCTNRKDKHADYLFFDREFNRFPVNEATAKLPEDFVFVKPARFEAMRALAEMLSKGIKHVRVDLYDTDKGVKFGEMTFFDQSGFADDYIGEGDRIMGEFLKLEEQA